MRISKLSIAAIAILFLGGCAHGAGADEVGHVLLGLLVALVAAKLGGELCVRLGQPAVLGELILGIVVGNLTLVGCDGLALLRTIAQLKLSPNWAWCCFYSKSAWNRI